MQNITKDLENKTVFLVPTGNLLSYNKQLSPFEQVVKATVNKVTKTFIFFTLEGYKIENKYRIHESIDNVINNGYNGGYTLFTSIEEVKSEELRISVIDHLIHKLHDISREEAFEISKILNIK